MDLFSTASFTAVPSNKGLSGLKSGFVCNLSKYFNLYLKGHSNHVEVDEKLYLITIHLLLYYNKKVSHCKLTLHVFLRIIKYLHLIYLCRKYL